MIKTRQSPLSDQSVQDVFIYLDTSTELTTPRITCGHYRPVSQSCQGTGRGDLAGQDRHGYEQWGVIFARSILACVCYYYYHYHYYSQLFSAMDLVTPTGTHSVARWLCHEAV